MSSLGIIQEENPQACQLCGIIAETRPYGPNGEEVCFDCGMKDEDAAIKRMQQLIFGDDDGNSSKA